MNEKENKKVLFTNSQTPPYALKTAIEKVAQKADTTQKKTLEKPSTKK